MKRNLVYLLGVLALTAVVFRLMAGIPAQAAAVTSATGTGNWSATAWPNTTRTGTITTNTASPTVNGTSTLFTSELSIGNIVKTTGNVIIGTVASITDNTHLTLTSNAASTNAGIAYNGQGVGPVDAATLANGANVTVDGNYTIASLTYTVSSATTNVTIASAKSLTVTGLLSMPRPAAGFVAGMTVGAGSLTAGNLTMSATVVSSGTRTDILSVSTGNVTVTGVFTSAGSTGCLLKFSGAGQMEFGGTLTLTGNPSLTAPSGTVKYSGAAQTGIVGTYNNLTLSGSSAKTFATTPTVNGVLSLEGTATVTVTTGVVTYGPSATLQYNTSTPRTSTTEEWITPFAATGGVIIAGTGAITTGGAKVFNASVPLTVNSGATLTPGANLLTFNGDLVNNGTMTSGSGGVTINGTATQSIGSITTTGTVTLTKTSGTATFTGSVSAGPLTINGSGGTLNLGTSLTHTFAGVVTLTAGTLNGGSSTLNENVTSTTAWGGTGTNFSAGTGTVSFGGAAQTLSATTTTFNNLTLGGSGAKTLTNANTVNGILSMEGTATSAGTVPTYGASATLQYKTATGETAGAEWITAFNGSGGVIVANTGIITLNSDKSFASVPLTINTGATLNASSFQLTFGSSNFAANGTFAPGTGTVLLNGTSSQTIGSALNFNNLTVNNAAGITISTDETVSGALTLTSGNITTGSNRVIITSSGSVSRTSGFVYGSLQRYVAQGSSSMTFDTGEGNDYAPVTVTIRGVGVAGSLTAKVTAGIHPNIASSSLDSTKTVSDYWTLTNSGVSFSNYDATFGFPAADLPSSANYTNLAIGKLDGSTWTYPTMGTRTATSAQATGITSSFSDFSVGDIMLAWASYNAAARVIQDDNFTSGENTVYMFGTGLSPSYTSYTVAYYDGSTTGGGQKVATDSGLVSNASGNLSSQYLLTADLSATIGTWHAAVFDAALLPGGGPPNNHNAVGSTPGYVMDHTFQVTASALPEFPTPVAGIAVAGCCFGLYCWMRKRKLLQRQPMISQTH